MSSTSVGQVVPVHKPEIGFVGQRRGLEGLATFSRAILSAGRAGSPPAPAHRGCG